MSDQMMKPYTMFLPTELVNQYKVEAKRKKTSSAELMRETLAKRFVTQDVDADADADALRKRIKHLELCLQRAGEAIADAAEERFL